MYLLLLGSISFINIVAAMKAYKKKKGIKDAAVYQGAKDALIMLDSVLLMVASKRLKAEHDFYYGDQTTTINGDPNAINARVAVRRRRDYKIMVVPGGTPGGTTRK